jgi:6-pyruvoyltetrahydropterin/6-carboxytetrahydropterin synthase
MKLSTSFEFDSAHRLVGYEGLCANLHGHIWKCELEIQGKSLDNIGMLWDFTNAKKLKSMFDHKTILKNCRENSQLVQVLIDLCGSDSVYLMDRNPTAENLCSEILKKCKGFNPKLAYKIKVYESPKSYAEDKR